MKNRIKTFGEWLDKEQIDGAIITSPDHVFYFTGFYSDPHERLMAIILFPKEEPFLILPQMETESARKAGYSYSIVGYLDTENPWDALEREMKKRARKVERMAIEKSHMNVERYEEIQNRFPGVSIVGAEKKLQEMRVIKDEEELRRMEKAGELADYAIEVGVQAIREGITELELVAIVEYELKKKGVEKMSFDTTILFGDNAANPHGSPGTRKLQRGEFVLFDLGVVYEGYCSDITRTVAFGEAMEKHVKVYNTVLKAQEAALEASRPGITCQELDQIARQIITEAGYGQYFTHRLGHGLGISIHEYPSVTGTNPLPLKKGMVFTIEPGIYIPGEIGVRIEDDVYITETGAKTLTKYPKELKIIQ